MKKLLGFILVLSIFSFSTFLTSCGDEGSPPFTIYNNGTDIDASEIDTDLNDCDELAWVENVQECCFGDMGCVPNKCLLDQRKDKCWISCEGRFGPVPTNSPRFVFDKENNSFKVDVAQNIIVSCSK